VATTRKETNACKLNLALMGINFRNGLAYISAWFEKTSTLGYFCCLPCRLVRFVQNFCCILQWLLEATVAEGLPRYGFQYKTKSFTPSYRGWGCFQLFTSRNLSGVLIRVGRKFGRNAVLAGFEAGKKSFGAIQGDSGLTFLESLRLRRANLASPWLEGRIALLTVPPEMMW